MSIDRAALEEAIDCLERCQWTSTHNKVLVAAARAHLATLPNAHVAKRPR